MQGFCFTITLFHQHAWNSWFNRELFICCFALYQFKVEMFFYLPFFFSSSTTKTWGINFHLHTNVWNILHVLPCGLLSKAWRGNTCKVRTDKETLFGRWSQTADILFGRNEHRKYHVFSVDFKSVAVGLCSDFIRWCYAVRDLHNKEQSDKVLGKLFRFACKYLLQLRIASIYVSSRF